MTARPPSSDGPEDDVVDAVDEPWSASAEFVAAVRGAAGRVQVRGDALVRASVAGEAGVAELWPGVAAALGLSSGFDLGALVRAEAGSRPSRAAPFPVVRPPELPVAANRSMAAAVAMLVSVAAVALLALGLRGGGAPRIEVARVDEVIVEDLVASAGVDVWVDEADDGSMILWIDDRGADL
jgi:hypothetical protein